MAVRTRAQLKSDADSALPDNSVGSISPADVRERIKDLADSAKLAEDLATTSANGLMSSEDKSKLDGIASGATANTGTVTSVGLSAPTGFSVSGSPVTGSGTLTFTYASGYEGFTTTLKNKLDGIEASADVTDATNVAAAGAIMDGDFSANGMMVRTASGTYASRTVTAGTGIAVTNGNGASGNPTVALSSGAQASLALADTAVQPGGLGPLATRAYSSGTGDPSGGSDGDLYLKYT